jgi:hypothetical protein
MSPIAPHIQPKNMIAIVEATALSWTPFPTNRGIL